MIFNTNYYHFHSTNWVVWSSQIRHRIVCASRESSYNILISHILCIQTSLMIFCASGCLDLSRTHWKFSAPFQRGNCRQRQKFVSACTIDSKLYILCWCCSGIGGLRWPIEHIFAANKKKIWISFLFRLNCHHRSTYRVQCVSGYFKVIKETEKTNNFDIHSGKVKRNFTSHYAFTIDLYLTNKKKQQKNQKNRNFYFWPIEKTQEWAEYRFMCVWQVLNAFLNKSLKKNVFERTVFY